MGWLEFLLAKYKDISLADLGGGQGGHGPPSPVKTSQKKDGRHARPQVSQVMWLPPPLDKFLDPLLHLKLLKDTFLGT